MLMLPTYFIPHGGGPCFFMDWPQGNPWESLEAWLQALPSHVGARPRQLLVISAHWEAARPTVTTNPKPPLIYDYTGFPPQTYTLRYDVPGSPELAARVRQLLDAAALPSAEDPRRGLDHGVFVPFKVIYPEADIPLVQLSLEAGYDPVRHLAIGAALAPLRDEGVLIAGSGMSFHNLERFFGGANEDAERFDAWLSNAVTSEPQLRNRLLEDWREAPSARAAHPEDDHLVPLLVAAGAAGQDRGIRSFSDTIYGNRISGYRFG
jgi:aromatic ring-opening dioxygenase catalytic subunit (LigB family)